jgi:peptidoglycan/LPS O-acetylase OafA/YrhL
VKTETSHLPSWVDRWHVNPSANKDYDLIDGLRGIAILMVLIGHQFYRNPAAGPWKQFFMVLINPGFGVIIFFALSGFLISLPFWKLKNKG